MPLLSCGQSPLPPATLCSRPTFSRKPSPWAWRPLSLVSPVLWCWCVPSPQAQPPCQLLSSQPSLLPAPRAGVAPAHLVIHADPVQGDVDGEGRGIVVWHQRGLLVRLVADNKGQVELGLWGQGSDRELVLERPRGPGKAGVSHPVCWDVSSLRAGLRNTVFSRACNSAWPRKGSQ